MKPRDWITSAVLHAAALAFLSGLALTAVSGGRPYQEIALFFESAAPRANPTHARHPVERSPIQAPASAPELGRATASTPSLLDASLTQSVTARIDRALDYPAELRARGQQGRAELEFELDLRGEIQRLALTRSTGFDRLDRLALQAVRKAAPYPELARFQRAIQLPVEFRLH